MSKPDYTTFRGDTIDVAVEFPGADLTDATLWITFKLKLDDVTNDDSAIWKINLDCNDASVCDDPTTGIAYIAIPDGNPENPKSGTYNLLPGKTYTLDIQANLSDGKVKTLQAKILVDRDGTRRTS